MDKKFFEILAKFRPCFSHEATYYWFILFMIGLVVRGDHYGVSSIVRWLNLVPGHYYSILHFFNSNGYTLHCLLFCWWRYCLQDSACVKIQGRSVIIGDHTNQPKDGRKMPGVVTIHQDSETSSKPGYFRGHVWGFLALLMGQSQKYFAVPLWGELNMKERNKNNNNTMTTRIVYNAILIAEKMNCPSYLTLDAYFAVGPVFLLASSVYSIAARVPWIHIITRAKKNAVVYLDPEPKPLGKRGPQKKYGEKITLIALFKERADEFLEATCQVYDHTENVKILCLDLLWKPIAGKIRFVLAITSRGPIVLMCSDLTLSAVAILELYCCRSSIENMFSVLKNLIGGLSYHFWAKLIEKSSRRPQKNKDVTSSTQKAPSDTIESKVRSIEIFVNLSAILVGILQILAFRFPKKIWKDNVLWLRTFSNAIPSEFIVKSVLAQTIFLNLYKVNAHAIYALIHSRQSQPEDFQQFEKMA